MMFLDMAVPMGLIYGIGGVIFLGAVIITAAVVLIIRAIRKKNRRDSD